MLKTKFQEMFGTKYPIVQAGMGPYSTTQLAASVARAGGLGLISTVGMGQFEMPGIGKFTYSAIFGEGSPSDLLGDAIDNVMNALEDSPDAKFGINIPVSEEFIPTAAELIQCTIDKRNQNPDIRKKLVAIFTSAGDPLPWAVEPGNKELAESIPIKTLSPDLIWVHVVPSVRAAKRCEKAGIDAVVASGREGGAHCSWRDTSSMVLIPEVVKTIKVPVIAAGGFADGASFLAALSLGAVGIQMGTRFIATQESEFENEWKNLIVSSSEEDAFVARGFFGPMRFLKNKRAMDLIDATLESASDLYKGIPCGSSQKILDLELGGMDHLFKHELGEFLDETPILGGTVAGRIHAIPNVVELCEGIIKEAESILKSVYSIMDSN